jgi:hypothetical protein
MNSYEVVNSLLMHYLRASKDFVNLMKSHKVLKKSISVLMGVRGLHHGLLGALTVNGR